MYPFSIQGLASTAQQNTNVHSSGQPPHSLTVLREQGCQSCVSGATALAHSLARQAQGMPIRLMPVSSNAQPSSSSSHVRLNTHSTDNPQNTELYLAILSQDLNKFSKFPEVVRNIPEVVLTAVRQNGLLLRRAGRDCKRNFHIALVAVRQNQLAMHYVDKEIKSSIEYAIECEKGT